MFKRKSKILYSNCDIPARLFFDELMHGNITVLGKGNPNDLYEAYWGVIDEFCDIDNNTTLRNWFHKQVKLSKLQRAISDVRTLLNPIKNLVVVRCELEACITLINALEYPKVNFDIEKPLDEEIKRVEFQVIGILENELNMLMPEQTEKKKEIIKDFSDRLVAVENALGRQIDDNVSLRKFISLEKSAIRKAKQNS